MRYNEAVGLGLLLDNGLFFLPFYSRFVVLTSAFRRTMNWPLTMRIKPRSTSRTALFSRLCKVMDGRLNLRCSSPFGAGLALIGIFMVGPTPSAAQGIDLSPLEAIHSGLRTCSGDGCAAVSDSLTTALIALLDAADPGSEIVPPGFMAAVGSSDRRLKVFTWNWAQPNRTSSYGGLVAWQRSSGAPLTYTRLSDSSSEDAPDIRNSVQAKDWNGALYYDLVPEPVDKDTWMLLGWDDADAMVTRKVIEPIQMRGRGVRFGAPVLNGTMGMSRRWVLEYADAVQVSLRYQPELKGKGGHPERIVFDHLGPSEPHLTGITAYYGPDMTFDAFVPGKKNNSPWNLAPNTTPIQTLPSDRPFVDPRPRNRRRNGP